MVTRHDDLPAAASAAEPGDEQASGASLAAFLAAGIGSLVEFPAVVSDGIAFVGNYKGTIVALELPLELGWAGV